MCDTSYWWNESIHLINGGFLGSIYETFLGESYSQVLAFL
jgi:hypothetical protein